MLFRRACSGCIFCQLYLLYPSFCGNFKKILSAMNFYSIGDHEVLSYVASTAMHILLPMQAGMFWNEWPLQESCFSFPFFSVSLSDIEQFGILCLLWPFGIFLQGKVKDIELKGHTDSVDQLCWDPKHADLIATASGDKTVRLWDARSKWTARMHTSV